MALILPYETIDEAIEIANGTRYGLGASVFGPDQEDCIKVAKQLQCGMVSVNDFAVFYASLLFFSSIKRLPDFRFCLAQSRSSLRWNKGQWLWKIWYGSDPVLHCGLFSHSSLVGGPEGLRALTNPKAVIIDRWPSFIQTSIPKVLDYPLRSLSHSWYVTPVKT